MVVTFHLKPSELDESVIKAIRALFKDDEQLIVTITSHNLDTQEQEKLFRSIYGSIPDFHIEQKVNPQTNEIYYINTGYNHHHLA